VVGERVIEEMVKYDRCLMDVLLLVTAVTMVDGFRPHHGTPRGLQRLPCFHCGRSGSGIVRVLCSESPGTDPTTDPVPG